MNVKTLSLESVTHPTWCAIDLRALQYNYDQLQKLAAKNMTRSLGIMPVIKADAYGHGMMQVAEVLNEIGCKSWVVSNLSEAMTLRSAGFKQKILILESNIVTEAKDIIEYHLTPNVCSYEMAFALNATAQAVDQQLPVHIKVDTGMGRLGVNEDQVMDFVQVLKKQCPHLILEGIFTHLPMADTDREFTIAQMRRFRDIVFSLENNFITFSYVHAGNSMGLGDYKSELFNVARPGIMLYGIYPHEDLKKKLHLKPVMSIKSRILFVQNISKGRGVSYGHTFKAKQDITVGVLPIGYSNGYFRALSNKAFVLIHGLRCPVIGRVTMDQIIVDITAVSLSGHSPKPGDEAVIMGTQKGETISIDEIAHWADTISYEICCSLGSRLPRVYHY